MEIIWKKITEIIPYENNPRHNDGAVGKVAESLKEFGWRSAITVDKDMIIIAGHTRYKAAKKLGIEKVPVHIASDLSPAQAKAYRIADNRVAQEATWDNELLLREFEDLKDFGFDFSLTGFNDDELKRFSEERGEFDDGKVDQTQYIVVIECNDEREQKKIYEEMEKRGLTCKLIM